MLDDYCDGNNFKKHALFSSNKQALQIFLYYDDVEVVNPIGSHKAVHKLGKFMCCMSLRVGGTRGV